MPIQLPEQDFIVRTDLEKVIDKLDAKIDRLDTKLWTAFITLVVMILGLYGTIIFGVILNPKFH